MSFSLVLAIVLGVLAIVGWGWMYWIWKKDPEHFWEYGDSVGL